MTETKIIPNPEKAKKILADLWSLINQNPDFNIDAEIDRLINSRFVSIRFCLPTQLLGKLTDQELDALCLQKGSGESETFWDPRSFSNKVIVPWVAENQYVLGTSTDPYVSKPLRKVRLEAEPGNVKGKEEWVLLYKVLSDVEQKNSQDYTRLRMCQTLLSIYRKYADLNFEYYFPERISLEQTEKIVTTFLSESSGGDRGLSVAAALFTTFGKHFGLFHTVNRSVINASDQSTGLAGDLECVDSGGNVKLIVEVKERNISLTDLQSSIRKARKISINELMLNTPGINKSEETAIQELIAKTWASGTNLYQLSIQELVRVGLAITGESGRKDFIKNIAKQLDDYNTQPSNRKRWNELLCEL